MYENLNIKCIETMIFNKNIFTVRQLIYNFRRFHSSQKSNGYEGLQKTTGYVNNVDDGPRLFIKEYSTIGFLLNNNIAFVGPIAIFPNAVFSWNIASGERVNEETLSLFLTIEPKLDLFILGLEKKYDWNKMLEMKKILTKQGIPTEVHSVEYACGFFNLVAHEGRFVAAGLIPPTTLIQPLKLEDKLTKALADGGIKKK